MSKQERISWVALLSHVLIGVWYFSRVLNLPADARLHSHFHFLTQLVVLAVILAIASEFALRWAQRRAGEPDEDGELRDERDLLIDLKAARIGYAVLLACIVVMLVQVGVTEWVQWNDVRNLRPVRVPATVLEALGTGPLTPMLMAQLLLAALTFGAASVYASRIYFYRRGF